MCARFTRRQFVGMTGAVAGFALLQACAPAPTPTPVPPKPAAPAAKAPAAAAKGTVSEWGWVNWAENDKWKGLDGRPPREHFEGETGIKLEYTNYAYADYLAALKTALPAGAGPDVFEINWQVLQPYASPDIVLPLDDLAKVTWGDWKKQFIPGLIDEVDRLGRGQAYFIPIYGQLLGYLFYSLPIFEKNKLSVPKTWAEFEAVCETLKKSGAIPLAVGGKDFWQQVDWFMSLTEVAAPGKLDEVQRGNGKLTDKDIVQTMHLHKKIYTSGWFAEGALGVPTAGGSQLFHEGKAAMMLLGTHVISWSKVATLKEASLTWGTFVVPDSKGLVATAWAMSIPKAAKNRDQAWRLVQWSSAEKGQEIVAAAPEPPAHMKYKMAGVGTVFDKNIIEPLIENMARGKNRLRWMECSALIDAVGPVMQGVASNQLTPEAAMAELEKTRETRCQK
ncbi:MAG: extracellular solute-binding protein [Chloroflexi bacterium]|nr:extracellular solute-binding protein [Chloroflexota bacterium]